MIRQARAMKVSDLEMKPNEANGPTMLMWQFISTTSISKNVLRIEMCKDVIREMWSTTGAQI